MVSAESIGIGIGIGAETFFAETETLYFFKSDSFLLQILLIFSSWGNKSFYKLEYKPSPSKIIQKYLMFGGKFGFRGPFMMKKKIPHASVTIFFL